MLYVLIAIAVIILAGVFLLLRRSSLTEGPPAEEATPSGGLGLTASEFRVAGGDAHVYYDVPLPDLGDDEVLTEILLRDAVEVLRSKRSNLPLDGVSTVHVHGQRGGNYVVAGTLTLDGPGELPPPPDPAAHPFSHRSSGPDLFDEIGAEATGSPGVEVRTPGDELPPLAPELRLTKVAEAGLRAQGIDPRGASFHDLVAGLLNVGGYIVTNDSGDALTASKGGVVYYVELVDHEEGDHPEFAERAVAGFIARYAQSGAARGLLFTPKYAPFVVYDRERREPKVRFITRERFQAFVDALTFG